jgi:hypothetical protein
VFANTLDRTRTSPWKFESFPDVPRGTFRNVLENRARPARAALASPGAGAPPPREAVTIPSDRLQLCTTFASQPSGSCRVESLHPS